MTTEERLEQSYLDGSRAAWRAMLGDCLRGLQVDASEPAREAWVAEREEAVAALRRVCTDHGDLDWEPKLHLADVIEGHLARDLEAPGRDDPAGTGDDRAGARDDPAEVCAGCSGLLLKGADPRCEDEKLCGVCARAYAVEDFRAVAAAKLGESEADHLLRLLAVVQGRPGPSGQ